MRSRVSIAVLLCAIWGAPSWAPASDAAKASPITAKNWRTHPRIVEIRSLVETNEAAIRSHRWRPAARHCEAKEQSHRVDAIAFRDGQGRIRKYTTSWGSDDSAYRIEHQYDGRGRLRFALAKAGAYNESVVTYRIYLDERGAEIWRHEESSGPGYTFLRPPEFPDEALVRDPAKDVTKPLRCEAGRDPT
jgi:hypothetical protein